MELINKLNVISTRTYLIAIPIFLILNFLKFIVIPKIADWELFSFNLYTCLILFIISSLIFFLLGLIIKRRINIYIIFALTMILPDIISLTLSGESIYINIFTSMVRNDNYILIAYPVSLIISFLIIIKKSKFIGIEK